MNPLFKKTSSVAFAAVAACTMVGGAHAADFPAKDKVITIVVPFAAGGPTDRRPDFESMLFELTVTVAAEPGTLRAGAESLN